MSDLVNEICEILQGVITPDDNIASDELPAMVREWLKDNDDNSHPADLAQRFYLWGEWQDIKHALRTNTR